ncbi:uncharacterized protein MELLADRAFT_116661 [Melampsora larici-populina 98AG31]|uniref:Transmembrane protein 188 n=1 Tax=Melampsora larici-populina (strain 98AG31 / pathotype 3-4-7) TaxID=747676 RepID=F4RNP6_MELLP|nr:uncharacterized protein MELLADRAFT_116661 [Melampsora larici-populina 98AG31]EGG06023.1 hypothetical protein MELLADRAFT_116661 [Melampsora larici-populina 98AG31]
MTSSRRTSLPRSNSNRSQSQSNQSPFLPPPANKETFKDLLIFEERLKQNSERLQRQRIKYEAFLFSLIIVTFLLAYKSFVAVSPYKVFHYSYVGLLLVAITTLILFFATGMYTDQIAYAYKFIPQTNRALRPFNMFLNTPPTSSPLKMFVSPKEPNGNLVPALMNPRGELLFSSKVSIPFIDGYESYRNEWERRRLPNSNGTRTLKKVSLGDREGTEEVDEKLKSVGQMRSRESTPDLLVDEVVSNDDEDRNSSITHLGSSPTELSVSSSTESDGLGEWSTVRR